MDLFNLGARLTLDSSDYERGLDSAEKKSGIFGGVLKANLVTKGIEVAIDGFKRLASAATNTVKNIVDSYAKYEQLAGGVETLFKGSADTVKKYAEQAYITAGLSANEYMETVTGFSASLIKSLGGDTKKAADLADIAIRDMSDNANKMGTDMASIQNAYQGFAKQNYTMLDNLKLGYGGTKSEMDRLIMDAAKLDKTFKYNTKTVTKNKKTVQELDYTYADIVQAIHIVQKDMGILGTTSKESAGTIEGSLNTLKAAWQNLIVGLGTGKSINKLINRVVESAQIAFKNIIPVVERGIYGLAKLVERMVPVIVKNVPKLLKKTLPSIIKAISSLISGVVQFIPDLMAGLFQAIYNLIPDFVSGFAKLLGGGRGLEIALGVQFRKAFNTVKDIFRTLMSALSDIWENVGKPMFTTIANFVVFTLIPAFSSIWKNVKPMIDFAIEGIKSAWTMIEPIFNSIIGFLSDLLPKNADDMKVLLTDLGVAFVAFKAIINIPAAIKNIKGVFDIITKVFNLLKANPLGLIATAIAALITYLVHLYQTNDEFRARVNAAWEAVKTYWETTLKPAFEELKKFIVEEVVPKVIAKWNEFKSTIKTVFENAKTYWEKTLKPALVELWDYIQKNIVPVIKDAAAKFDDLNKKYIQPLAKFIADKFMSAWKNLHNYWVVTLSPKITALMNTFGKLWNDKLVPFAKWLSDTFFKTFQTLLDDYIKPVGNWIMDSLAPAWAGVEQAMSGLLNFITGVFEGDWEKAWNGLVDLASAPFMALGTILKEPINGVIDLLNTMIEKVETAINKVIQGINDHVRIKLDPIYILGNKVWDGLNWGAHLNKVKWGRIHKLAQGGILGEGQQALVGEYAPEHLQVVNGRAIVTPIKGQGRLDGGNTYNTTINVYQQPGEDAEELARRIDQIFARNQKQRKAAFV